MWRLLWPVSVAVEGHSVGLFLSGGERRRRKKRERRRRRSMKRGGKKEMKGEREGKVEEDLILQLKQAYTCTCTCKCTCMWEERRGCQVNGDEKR